MAKIINYINLIYDFVKIENGNDEEMKTILGRYGISNIESLERKIFHYIFSIRDNKLRSSLVDLIIEDDKLPCIYDCYKLLCLGISKEEYIERKEKNVKGSTEKFSLSYNLCIKIISQSSVLQKNITFLGDNKYNFNNTILDEINYINLIYDLEIVGKNNKDGMREILLRYDIPKIESLERRVLEYVFSINDEKFKFNLINMLAESSNLPIIKECYNVIYSSKPKYEYVTGHIISQNCIRQTLNKKYDRCINIISQSSYLQEIQRIISEYKNHNSADTAISPIKIISHKRRNKVAKCR